jgi:hypothetical protein
VNKEVWKVVKESIVDVDSILFFLVIVALVAVVLEVVL